ncbi:hypothetical protein IC619_014650 [Hazenella sp. IB182353]|uniref:hypothetical protein n=1 Tax=Polycladospora coralii TaxID=2771432 RepID=UPI001747C239|nr:hypothetical protein [Polycladospora coralii]MBS7531722.1 hypothetical protein [Polycladospora coralii]
MEQQSKSTSMEQWARACFQAFLIVVMVLFVFFYMVEPELIMQLLPEQVKEKIEAIFSYFLYD